MARAAQPTDTASTAQGRFTVQLPAELGRQLDELGERMRKAVEDQIGFAPELSRASVVQALVRSALQTRAASRDEPVASNGAEAAPDDQSSK